MKVSFGTKILGFCMAASFLLGCARWVMEPSLTTFEPPLAWSLGLLFYMAWSSAESECYILGKVCAALVDQIKEDKDGET